MTKKDQARRSPGGSTGRAAGPAQVRLGRSMGGFTDEVARRIEGYAPRDIPSPLWEETLRPFMLPALRASKPVGLAAMEQFARVLTLISAWCLEQGIPLDIEIVLDPDTVERCFSEGMRHIPSRGVYRTVLRRLGRMLTKKAPWQPRPEPMTRRKVALPYSPAELAAVEEDARRQPTAIKRRTALGLIALGAGAGLDGRWATRVRGTDVARAGGVVTVRVSGKRPRSVVVLDRYEDLLLDLAAEAGAGYIVGGPSPHRNRTNKRVSSLARGHGHPKLSVPRLRSTWIVEHLSRGTRLPELLEAAGTSRIETFDELLAFVEPVEPGGAEAMLRGPG